MDKNVISINKKEPVLDLSTRRTFTIETTSDTYYIRRPTAESIRSSDWVYSKIYNEAFLNGVMTAAQMMEEMKNRGIISEQYEKDLNDTREAIANATTELVGASTLDDKEQAALRLTVVREQMTLLNHRINGPLSNTCEQLAEDAKLDYITSSVVENESGHRIWSDYDAYVADTDSDKVFKSRLEVMMYLRNVDSDFLETSPEQTALREVGEERQKMAEKNVEEIEEGLEEIKQKAKSMSKKSGKKAKDKKVTKKKTAKKKATKKKVAKPSPTEDK